MCAIKRIEEILKALHTQYPDSKCSLLFTNPFELLVGTILSSQSTDERVNKILPKLLSNYPDAHVMSNADLKNIKSIIKSLGLFNNKAKSLIAMSHIIVSSYNGNVPATMTELIKLPGVGRKTANVVLGNALGIFDSGITVDTHVIRISKKLHLTRHSTATKIERDLMNIVPINEWVDITHLFIDHGRAICNRKPKCDICVISNWCPSKYDFPHLKKNSKV